MDKIQYLHGGKELLHFVKPMWDKLNNYHKVNSHHFASHFESLTFESRKKKFEREASLQLRVDLVKDSSIDTYIGYCISTVAEDQIGEIDSLYVEPQYRKYGIGDKLMREALNWLDEKDVNRKIIGVAEGNEKVLYFYERYGFYPKMILLQEVK